MTTLFDDPDTLTLTHDEDPAVRRTVRRLALGGALQLVRTRHGLNVTEAAAQAGMAPMTWRRMEDGLEVRDKSHAALDRMLNMAIGTLKRALADDGQMLELLKLSGVDTRHVSPDGAADFLAEFADQLRTDSPRQRRAIGPVRSGPDRPRTAWPAVEDRHRQALEAMSMHVPAVRPTDLEVVQKMVDQLTRKPVTPLIRELIEAALRAMPDLIERQLDEAERDIKAAKAQDAAEMEERARHEQPAQTDA